MSDAAGRPYHLQVGPGDLGGFVLLPGDPGRVERIARLLDQPWHIASNREFTTWTGALAGVPVSVTSTGIGGPSTAIAVEELCDLGAHTLVRVGTCGGMQPAVGLGDLVLAQAAVRDEGTSAQYVPAAWPATAHVTVLDALRGAAAARGVRHHVGTVQSKDSFYGEMRPGRMPVAAELEARWRAWVAAGVLACVNATPVQTAMPAPEELDLDDLLGVAVDAVRRLVEAG